MANDRKLIELLESLSQVNSDLGPILHATIAHMIEEEKSSKSLELNSEMDIIPVIETEFWEEFLSICEKFDFYRPDSNTIPNNWINRVVINIPSSSRLIQICFVVYSRYFPFRIVTQLLQSSDPEKLLFDDNGKSTVQTTETPHSVSHNNNNNNNNHNNNNYIDNNEYNQNIIHSNKNMDIDPATNSYESINPKYSSKFEHFQKKTGNLVKKSIRCKEPKLMTNGEILNRIENGNRKFIILLHNLDTEFFSRSYSSENELLNKELIFSVFNCDSQLGDPYYLEEFIAKQFFRVSKLIPVAVRIDSIFLTLKSEGTSFQNLKTKFSDFLRDNYGISNDSIQFEEAPNLNQNNDELYVFLKLKDISFSNMNTASWEICHSLMRSDNFRGNLIDAQPVPIAVNKYSTRNVNNPDAESAFEMMFPDGNYPLGDDNLIELKGEGVGIAVFDTPFPNSDSILNKLTVGGHNYVKQIPGPILENVDFLMGEYDKSLVHSTKVISVIKGHNQLNGIAPNATVIPFVIDDTGVLGIRPWLSNSGLLNLVNALNTATNMPNVDIISISMGVLQSNRSLKAAVSRARLQNKIVVCAAGNFPFRGFLSIMIDPFVYPAKYPECIGVQGYERLEEGNYRTWDDSGFGPYGDVSGIASPVKVFSVDEHMQDQTIVSEGTSFATPAIASVIAQFLQRNRHIMINMCNQNQHIRFVDIIKYYLHKTFLNDEICRNDPNYHLHKPFLRNELILSFLTSINPADNLDIQNYVHFLNGKNNQEIERIRYQFQIPSEVPPLMVLEIHSAYFNNFEAINEHLRVNNPPVFSVLAIFQDYLSNDTIASLQESSPHLNEHGYYVSTTRKNNQLQSVAIRPGQNTLHYFLSKDSNFEIHRNLNFANLQRNEKPKFYYNTRDHAETVEPNLNSSQIVGPINDHPVIFVRDNERNYNLFIWNKKSSKFIYIPISNTGDVVQLLATQNLQPQLRPSSCRTLGVCKHSVLYLLLSYPKHLGYYYIIISVWVYGNLGDILRNVRFFHAGEGNNPFSYRFTIKPSFCSGCFPVFNEDERAILHLPACY